MTVPIAGAIFGDLGLSLFVGSAIFDDLGLSLFVAQDPTERQRCPPRVGQWRRTPTWWDPSLHARTRAGLPAGPVLAVGLFRVGVLRLTILASCHWLVRAMFLLQRMFGVLRGLGFIWMMFVSCRCFKISAMINSNGCWSLEGFIYVFHDVP